MIDQSTYLLEVSFCIGIFYALYIFLFKNTTFHHVNRLYLFFSLTISFVIPVLHVPVVPLDYHILSEDFMHTPSRDLPDLDADKSIATVGSPMNFSILLAVVYWTGFAIMTLRLLFSLIKIFKIKNQSSIRLEDNVKIVRTDLSQPFSYFNLIFLPKNENRSLIIQHEKVHVSQYHWIDLLFTEIAATILWFNPIMILYKRSVKIQHEYLADACTIKRGAKLEQYLECLLLQIQTENEAEFISQFYSKTIKNRIIMMTKNKTSHRSSALYLLLIPAVCILLFSFSSQPTSSLLLDTRLPVKDGEIVVIVDAGHGGQDKGAHGTGDITEKAFALSMAKGIQKAGEESNVKVILTRTGDEALTLEERTLFSNRFDADLFISLHVNYDDKNATTSGISCVVSESNIQFGASKQLADQLVNELQTLPGIAVNGIKKADFYVVKNNSVPAVLLDLGYLSNEKDYAYIREAKNQQLISQRVIAAVRKYSK